MESYSSRATSSLSLFLTVLAVVTTLNALSAFFYPQKPVGRLSIGTVFDFTVHPYLEADQSNVNFHMKADLRSAFQWNTNQLFAYVTAKYVTPKNERNEVVLWDRIIRTPEDALFEETNILNEYPLRDRYRLLKNRSINLTLAYRYMPIVGQMKEYVVTTSTFTMGDRYFQYDPSRHREHLAIHQKDEELEID